MATNNLSTQKSTLTMSRKEKKCNENDCGTRFGTYCLTGQEKNERKLKKKSNF